MNDVLAWENALATLAMAQQDIDDLGGDYEDAELDLLGPAHTSAMLNMAATPAPDWAAYVRKFEMLVADEIIEACGPYFQPALDALLADARRLGGIRS
jgi:hypothetical protein